MGLLSYILLLKPLRDFPMTSAATIAATIRQPSSCRAERTSKGSVATLESRRVQLETVGKKTLAALITTGASRYHAKLTGERYWEPSPSNTGRSIGQLSRRFERRNSGCKVS